MQRMKLRTMAISLILSGLIAGTGCTTLEGESKMKIGSAPAGAVSHNPPAGDDLVNALARVEMAEASAAEARAEAAAAKAALDQASKNPAAVSNQLFPANAVPGKCYARVLLGATFVEQSEQILVRPETTRIEVTQAKYDWVEEQKLVRQSSTRIEVIPAEYKTVTEQIIIKPETTRLVSVPAQYEQVTEQIVDKPAYTEWRRGQQHTDRANSSIPSGTGTGSSEVIRMVEVPATYKTITRSVQTTPASVKEVMEPAEYKSVAKTVVSQPTSTREVIIPAQYTTVRTLKLVTPSGTQEVTIPAEYETITKRIKTSDESLEWREVFCDADMTSGFVSELQNRLRAEGYFDSPVDGIYQRLTQNGINRYAKNNGLPFGADFITLEVANALGLSY
jgi:peptidoglycan hydrolase-like protein with peptidoglycan-binding domain